MSWVISNMEAEVDEESSQLPPFNFALLLILSTLYVFPLTSNELKVIICDYQAVNLSFLPQTYPQNKFIT